MRNIVLIGMRGSGKTTVGKLLAERLGYGFLDTDELVVKKAEKSIQDIVAQEGWERFRDLESEVVEEVGKRSSHVIACGGGVVIRDENIQALSQSGTIVWLNAPVSVLAERVRKDDSVSRPPLMNAHTLEEELEHVLKEREPLYRKVATFTVSAEKDPRIIMEEIIHSLQKI